MLFWNEELKALLFGDDYSFYCLSSSNNFYSRFYFSLMIHRVSQFFSNQAAFSTVDFDLDWSSVFQIWKTRFLHPRWWITPVVSSFSSTTANKVYWIVKWHVFDRIHPRIHQFWWHYYVAHKVPTKRSRRTVKVRLASIPKAKWAMISDGRDRWGIIHPCTGVYHGRCIEKEQARTWRGRQSKREGERVDEERRAKQLDVPVIWHWLNRIVARVKKGDLFVAFQQRWCDFLTCWRRWKDAFVYREG